MAAANKSRVDRRKSKAKPRGPKPSITLDVVKRVAERFGRGIPVVEALAAECNPKINLDTWHKALQKDEKLSTHWAGARGKFLDQATRRLHYAEQEKYLCWLLERRYSDLFAKRDSKPSDVADSERARSTEIPDDILQRAHQLAKAGSAGGPMGGNNA